MAGSRLPLMPGLDPFEVWPITPGVCGFNDMGDPDTLGGVCGDTGGVLGWNDWADPDMPADSPAQLQSTREESDASWDYDPKGLLDDKLLNPEFVKVARRVLVASVNGGLTPRVHAAYRSPTESERQNKNFKAGKGGRAAPGWQSCHNYGLAMDVYLYDAKGLVIDNFYKGPTKGYWYKQFKSFSSYALKEGMVWGENFGSGDSDHFEYHPNWKDGAGGSLLLAAKKWAEDAAADSKGQWMEHFWWAAGAGGTAPSQSFLAKHAPPQQKKK